MKFFAVVFVVVLFATNPGAAAPQNAPAPDGNSEQSKHALAISALREINTAEYEYLRTHGSFATWDALLASGAFSNQATNGAQVPHFSRQHLATGTEILPGWTLRLSLTPDAKGYNAILEDTTDHQCGYAAVTDERAIIRQSKTIDCAI